MSLKGMNQDSKKAAEKLNQTILLNTKYKKEPNQQADQQAKQSPSTEELTNG